MDKKNKLCVPGSQYGSTSSPGVLEKKKTHIVEILPPTIQLNKDEKEVAECFKVLVFQSMPMTVRRNQMNQSGKKASVGALQPSSATAMQPTSSLAKRPTLSTDATLITNFLKSGFFHLLQKPVTHCVMEEGGSICVDRLR
jgi:hypothetical protein